MGSSKDTAKTGVRPVPKDGLDFPMFAFQAWIFGGFYFLPALLITMMVLCFHGYAVYVLSFLAIYFPISRSVCNVSDGNGLRLDWYCRMGVWKRLVDYLGYTLVRTAELDPKKQYVFGMHPHAIVPVYITLICMFDDAGGKLREWAGGMAGSWRGLFPGITTRGLAASPNFHPPLWREAYTSAGYVTADSKSARNVLKRGHSIIVTPGGEKEMIMANPNKDQIDEIVLKDVKGFVKLAIRDGAILVPVWAFGAQDTFSQAESLRSFHEWTMRKYHAVLPLFYGRWYTPLPRRTPVVVVVGAPLEMPPKSANPTQEQIDDTHARYTKALLDLHAEWKDKVGFPESKVVVH